MAVSVLQCRGDEWLRLLCFNKSIALLSAIRTRTVGSVFVPDIVFLTDGYLCLRWQGTHLAIILRDHIDVQRMTRHTLYLIERLVVPEGHIDTYTGVNVS
jgi:hypothetical protein